MDTSVETEKAETTTISGGNGRTDNTRQDASRSSSPQDGTRDSSPTDGEEDSPPAHGGTGNGAMSEANKRLESLLSGKAEGEEETPASTTEGEETPSGESAHTDERTDPQAQPKPADALSQEQEQAFNKSFSDRKEWGTAISIAKKLGPEAEKEMRQAMRQVFFREQGILRQVEKLKPAQTAIDEIRTSLGSDDAVQQLVSLAKMYGSNHPETEKLLEHLLNDFRVQNGRVLSSPDLLKRAQALKQRFDDGMFGEDEYQQQLRDLSEIEQARSGQRSAGEKVKQREAADEQARQADAEQALVNAVDTWEKGLRDADYPAIRKLVSATAMQLVTAEVQETQRDMTPKRMVELCNQALQQVKSQVAGLGGKKRSIRPAPDGDGSSERLGEQEPKDPAKAMIWRQKQGRG